MSLFVRRVCHRAVRLNRHTLASSRFRRITSISRYLQNAKRHIKSPALITLHHRQHHCDDKHSDPRTRDYAYNYRAHNTTPSLIRSNQFDPSNTPLVFQSLSTYHLLKQNLMFTMLSFQSLTGIMINIMKNTAGAGLPAQNQQTTSATKPTPFTVSNLRANKLSLTDVPGVEAMAAILGIVGNVVAKPINYIVRKQYFPLFTGGENIRQCIQIAKKYNENNIRLIIDNSTEEGNSHAVFERNLNAKKELVDVSHDNLSRSVMYMAMKMTSCCSPTLLEQMTHILRTEQPLDRDPTPFMNDEQLKELEYTLSNLLQICQHAKDHGIGVWLDAEQYSRQMAMNYVSRRLQQELNHKHDDKIYLFNTYQCYLKDAPDWIAFDIEHAKLNGYTCGVKLVRGAYMDYERQEAVKAKREDPIQASKDATDRAYNAAISYVMHEIVEAYGNVGIAVCTHNRESLVHATSTMEKLGIERDDNSVVMAQLCGMVDNLTYALGYGGYNALKLMPYGEFNDVWPYLMRRFEENSQIMNGLQQERSLYSTELKRRFRSLIPF
eukprot:CAMPEP_0197023252 /NCGR_PEP_ID=MMETSP1384-20130603/4002_1 /TAXON_ID=29189 /ORGANISM="Ammonia sp." /LENGTH=549 /DNA_ID=CAMNT_0042451445 /DNA_START=51 /DNA_END=1700 /DNA_ORIENTATION=+